MVSEDIELVSRAFYPPMGGRTRTQGGQGEQLSAAIFGMADGLIRSVKLFTHADDARRDAGLEQ